MIARDFSLIVEFMETQERRHRRGDKKTKKSRNYATLRMCTVPQVRSSNMPVVYLITLTG